LLLFSAATLISYHNRFRLSTTFLKSFLSWKTLFSVTGIYVNISVRLCQQLFFEIFSSFFRAVVLSRRCLNNESEYIIPHCTCQHYFSNFLHKSSPATSIPHKQGIFAMFLFCFLLFYKERKLLSELFHQICQIVIFIQTCKYSAVSGIIYDHLAQGSQISEDIKCVYCPNN